MNKAVLSQIGAVGGPLVAFMIARVLLAPAPVVSSAMMPTSSPEAIPVAGLKPPTPQQQRALQWCDAQFALAATSPFTREIFPPTIVAIVPEAPEPQPEPEPELESLENSLLEGLRLAAVLSSSDGGLALINGRVYRIGQQVRPGVTLTGIDARRNRVHLTDPHGKVWIMGQDPEPR